MLGELPVFSSQYFGLRDMFGFDSLSNGSVKPPASSKSNKQANSQARLTDTI